MSLSKIHLFPKRTGNTQEAVQDRMVLVVIFFSIFFCFVAAIFDLVHDVEALFHLL